MLGHDLARTGVADTAGPALASVLWARELGGSVDGAPILVGDRIYVGSSSGRFFALKRETGEELWHFDTGGTILGGAQVAEGRVFFGSADRFLYAVGEQTHKLLWRHRTLRPVMGGATVVPGKVVFGSMDGAVRAVDSATGRIIWKTLVDGGVSTALAVNQDVAYCGDEAGGVRALRLADGKELWAAKLSGRVVASPTIAAGKLLVPLMALSMLSPPQVQYLTAWSLSDGKKLWTVKPEDGSVTGLVTSAGGKVWAFTVEGYTSNGRLRCFDVEGGAPQGDVQFGTLVADAGIVYARGTLYVVGQNGIVYFMDSETGTINRTVQLGGKAFSSPAVADGRLYVGCQDGKLYCIG